MLGFDARPSKLARAVAKGICKSGANVLDIGLAEQVYAAVSAFGADAV